MTLKEAKNGKLYVVEESTIGQPVKRRLEAMGLIEGTLIRKINQALDGSIIFMVRGNRLAIGKELADYILLREALDSDLERGRRGSCRDHGRGRGHGRGHGHGRGFRGTCARGQALGKMLDSDLSGMEDKS